MRVLRSRRSLTVRPKLRPRIPVNRVYRDTRSELKKISWPSREETIRLTLVVIALSLFMAFFLGVVVDGSVGYVYRSLLDLR